MREAWVELFADGWAWWEPHTGVVGVTAGVGITTCISHDVSCLAGSYSFLIVALNMWYENWGEDIRRSSSQSLDRSDRRFPQPKRKRSRRLFARECLKPRCFYLHHLFFAGWATMGVFYCSDFVVYTGPWVFFHRCLRCGSDDRIDPPNKWDMPLSFLTCVSFGKIDFQESSPVNPRCHYFKIARTHTTPSGLSAPPAKNQV